MITPLIALFTAVALLAVIIWMLRRVDAVISDIYARNRPRWEELGSPTGFFWRPRETVPFLKSTGSRNALAVTALFSPEELLRPHSSKRNSPNEKKA